MGNAPSKISAIASFSSNQQKWQDHLRGFEEVLHANIFIMDGQGHLLIPPKGGSEGQKDYFGSVFLGNSFGLPKNEGEEKRFLASFISKEAHLEAANPFEFRLLATPLELADEKNLFYVVTGPVIIDESWSSDKYVSLSEKMNLGGKDLLEEIKGVVVMSQAAANMGLDLLGKVIKDIFELDLEKEEIERLHRQKEVMPREVADVAQDLLVAIKQDELLVTVLDAAIAISKTEGGSIMILDEEKGELVIRVSRGLENKKSILQARLKIGQGIAGMAALGKTPMLIKGTQGDNRIRHLLKRPEIKESLVIPLAVQDKVVGVLNLSTKSEDGAMERAFPDIRQLSAFLAKALCSF